MYLITQADLYEPYYVDEHSCGETQGRHGLVSP